jgi:hypothetical protein
MTPVPQSLSPTVIAASRGITKLEQRVFYRRLLDREKAANTGTFITQEDIERRHSPPLSSMLRGIPSVKIHVAPGGVAIPMSTLSGGCVMATYVDGVRFQTHSSQSLAMATTKINPGYLAPGAMAPSRVELGLDQFIQSNTVAGIEVYPRPLQVPGEYQLLNGDCGVILIWTK